MMYMQATDVKFNIMGTIVGGVFSQDGKELVLATDSGEVLRRHMYDGNSSIKLKESSGQISMAAFSPDINYVAGICGDGRIKVWNLCDGVCVTNLIGHRKGADYIAFNDDGSCIITASRKDRSIRIWRFPHLQKLIDIIRAVYGPELLSDKEQARFFLGKTLQAGNLQEPEAIP